MTPILSDKALKSLARMVSAGKTLGPLFERDGHHYVLVDASARPRVPWALLIDKPDAATHVACCQKEEL